MLVWEEGYRIGVESMDAEHLILLSILNQLEINLEEDMTAVCLPDVLNALVSYIHYHFRNEEELMLRIGFPDYRDHVLAHQEFERELERLQNAVHTTSDAKALAIEVRLFVRSWLINHILIRDNEYAQYAADSAA